MSTLKITLAALVAGGAMAAAPTSLRAAPLPTHLATMKAMVTSDAIEVRWGGWGGGWRGGGWGYRGGWGHRPWGAVAAGALIGGALAGGAYYGSYGYGSYYGSYPYYGGGYAYQNCPPYGGYGYGGYSPAYAYGW